MTDSLIVRQCAPTLAGIKTGSLFCCSFESRGQLLADLRGMNGRLSAKGIRFVPLRIKNGRALVYVFRPGRLCRDLINDEAAEILDRFGYGDACAKCGAGAHLARLVNRLRESDSFPHEIGLFLGYPPGDVRRFIECNGRNCKCTGCWKVYGDIESAEKTFRRYDKCTEVYCRELARGRSLDRLTASTV